MYAPDHSETVEADGKLVVVCSDTAQITKICKTTKENTFAFSSLFMVMSAANTSRPSLS